MFLLCNNNCNNTFLIKYFLNSFIGESNGKVDEYGNSRYLRNHKSYKKMFNE